MSLYDLELELADALLEQDDARVAADEGRVVDEHGHALWSQHIDERVEELRREVRLAKAEA